MIGVDSILLFPMKGLLFACREIRKAAQQQTMGQADAIRTELRELYMMLEAGRITEADFDAREAELLDRLDELEAPDGTVADDSDGPLARENEDASLCPR